MVWRFCRQQRRARRWVASLVTFQLLIAVAYYGSSIRTANNYEVDAVNSAKTLYISNSKNDTTSGFDAKRSIVLEEDLRPHFQQVGKAALCFVEGTDIKATEASKTAKCKCLPNYHGRECGIPSSVWYGGVQIKYHRWKLKPRKVPRRIVHGFNINHEIDFFRVRLEELQDAVDVYIVCESNYTANGDVKPLYLLEKLNSGFMASFHPRIVHVQLNKFPERGRHDGWFIDMYLRTYMGLSGLKRISGLRSDDLFVLLDADEIPTKEVLMFLKLYDGYPEPVRLGLRWSVFGFFWKRKKEKDEGSLLRWVLNMDEREYEEDLLEVTAVSTMAMVWEVCQNNTFLIRKDMSSYADFQERVSKYRIAQPGRRVQPWTAGTRDYYAGHHCSWCYTAEGIRIKLSSAHLDDSPRWGNYPEKLEIPYINKLIRTGEWFDGTKPLLVADWEKEEQYAPRYVLDHEEEFKHLLYPPDSLSSS